MAAAVVAGVVVVAAAGASSFVVAAVVAVVGAVAEEPRGTVWEAAPRATAACLESKRNAHGRIK